MVMWGGEIKINHFRSTMILYRLTRGLFQTICFTFVCVKYVLCWSWNPHFFFRQNIPIHFTYMQGVFFPEGSWKFSFRIKLTFTGGKRLNEYLKMRFVCYFICH